MQIKYQRILAVSILLSAILIIVIGRAVKWHDGHEIHGRAPISVHLQLPVFTTLRKLVTFNTVADANNSPLSPDQQYLCNKFAADCKIALAIQRAENGSGKCDIINWSNKNESLDIGFMQINTLYIDKNVFKPSQLFDCRQNIDAAYQIYQSWHGFGAWSTFNNGAYKKYLW